MWKTSGFHPHGFRSSEEPHTVSLPTQNTEDRFGVPTPSIREKYTDLPVNSYSTATLCGSPWEHGWEQNFFRGMPLFTNSVRNRSNPADRSTLTASPAVCNFMWEDGARKKYQSTKTRDVKLRGELLRDYSDKNHIYGNGEVDGIEKYWNYFGFIKDIIGKSTPGAFSGSRVRNTGLILTCDIYGTTQISNYWGQVETGDRIGWMISEKNNPWKFFYDPKGNVVGEANDSPESFMQLYPVIHKANGQRISHNTSYEKVNEPNDEDLDYVKRGIYIEQYDTKINMFEGTFTTTELNLQKEVIKNKYIKTDLYSFGKYIYIGTVASSPTRTIAANSEKLRMALRNDIMASELPMVDVHVGI